MVLPSDVRRALGITPGERALLILEEGTIRVLTANAAATGLRSGNPATQSVPAAADLVRDMRVDDAELSDGKAARVAAGSNSRDRTDQEVLAELLADLGMAD